MKGVRMDLEIFGETAISRDLLRFGDRMTDARPAFENILEMMEDDIAELFESEGTSGGTAWEALSDETLRRKAALNQQPDVLQATRALLDSLTADTHGSGIRQASAQELVFGSSLMTDDGKYNISELHQKGTENMPARPPLQFSETQKRNYIKELQRYVIEGERGLV